MPTRNYYAILLPEGLFCLICTIAVPQSGFGTESNVDSTHISGYYVMVAILYTCAAAFTCSCAGAKAQNRQINYSHLRAIAALPFLVTTLTKNKGYVATTKKRTSMTSPIKTLRVWLRSL